MTEEPGKRPAPDMPPLPRDHASSLLSEVLPFKSRKIRIWRSKLLAPMIVGVVACLLLFTMNTSTLEGNWNYALVVGALILFAVFMLLHAYTRSTRPLLAFSFPALFTVFSIGTLPGAMLVFMPIAFVFRTVLPGGEIPPGSPFIDQFVNMFFAAGLCEEMIKAVPVLLMVGLGLSSLTRQQTPAGQFANAMSVRTPLDGLLAGAASGAGFILAETFGQYYNTAFAGAIASTNDEYAGVMAALQLSIPRSLQGIVGHMAWAGIVGYAIGLGIRRPKLAIPLVLGGWLLSSVLHAFWNSSYSLMGDYGLWVAAFLTLPIFVAATLKARQLEPAPAAAQYEGSIVVGSAAPGMAPLAPRAAAPAKPATPAAPPVEVAAPPLVQPVPEARSPVGLVLVAGGIKVAVVPGDKPALASVPGLEKQAAGFAAEVTTHPTDASVIGLKNLGTGNWTVFSPTGSSEVVAPQRAARLQPGGRILHNSLVILVAKQT
jgi:RsiW-degrading membrane proteinase PrsW (M82 family)